MFQKCSVTKNWTAVTLEIELVVVSILSVFPLSVVVLYIEKESSYVRKKHSEGNIGVYCSILSI